MGVYSRFKRSPNGFRQLVELLESTPLSRRKRMIDVGMEEDADYTQRALSYVMTFEDVLGLNDLELAEVVAVAPPRMTAIAINQAAEETKKRFLLNAQPRVRAEISDYLSLKVGLAEIGGAQLKLIETTRQLERKGLVKTKHIEEA